MRKEILAIVYCVVILCITTADTDGMGEIGKETGTLELNEDQFYDLTIGNVDSVEVTKLAEHQYSCFKPNPRSDLPPSYIDCWKSFDQYISDNVAIFQTWANQNCRPYRSCWCCRDGGLHVAFFIKPTRLCTTIADQTYVSKIPVFENIIQN